MKHIRRQRSVKAARLQMLDVAIGDTVIVHIRGKEIPCVVRMCNTNLCMHCVLLREGCMMFRGSWTDDKDRKGFIPLEDTVE